jgi:type II secretory ATPase GspE/PulE/Tfp pilus assembly ATPase PilB-like protein
VTGPTGSGKTTTLYATLNKINAPELNIITIEDPIEYQLGGIGQIQVNRDRPDVRERTTIDSPPGSGYHHGGRDS